LLRIALTSSDSISTSRSVVLAMIAMM